MDSVLAYHDVDGIDLLTKNMGVVDIHKRAADSFA
jgi:hypothetical protein